jgi:hypothetical protein
MKWAAAAGGVADGDKGDVTVSASGATWTIDTDAVTYAKIQDVSATSRVLGRITAGAGDVEELTGANIATIAGGTSGTTLALGNHTHTAANVSDFDTQVRTSRLDQMSAPTGSVSVNSQKITNLATPTTTTDAANKSYVDGLVGGTETWGIDGAATVRTGKARIYNDSGRTRTITAVRLSADTAPSGTTSTPVTGAAMVADVNLGGTTIFATQANRPAIPSGSNTHKTTGMGTTAWTDGSYLTVDIDFIGSTTAGSDVTVTVTWA